MEQEGNCQVLHQSKKERKGLEFSFCSENNQRGADTLQRLTQHTSPKGSDVSHEGERVRGEAEHQCSIYTLKRSGRGSMANRKYKMSREDTWAKGRHQRGINTKQAQERTCAADVTYFTIIR